MITCYKYWLTLLMKSANALSLTVLCVHQKYIVTQKFTTVAEENIHVDHNPSSATAKDSFHCTGISLIQHLTHKCAFSNRGVLVISQSVPSTRSIRHMPVGHMLFLRQSNSRISGLVKPLDFLLMMKSMSSLEL